MQTYITFVILFPLYVTVHALTPHGLVEVHVVCVELRTVNRP